ncbi:DUF6414 family protein [Clostridium sartagoforme]|uniref:Uncharacterized protein n=1 Tax=Clostridium sartagoforme AAU1 TaxID=1202534 RepID=R9BTG3_9CLOT|nr:DUF6414 family protein [Clostridium sartagoforme]EOR20424.1 hypothetical protein A500_17365 [Clostridium sartagoforme AAU1]
MRSKKEKKTSKIIKVIYFDECSATDFLEITNGGKVNVVDEESKGKTKQVDFNIAEKLGVKLKLFSFVDTGVEQKLNGQAKYLGQSLMKTTLSNTVLSDYINTVANEESIMVFKGFKLSAYPNSLAHFKMFSPYSILNNDDNGSLNISKLDEALESAKGYYELIAENGDNPKKILRFNIKAFRNNYGISDVIKMDLTYHAIKVGSFPEERLTMENEFQQLKNDLTVIETLDNKKKENILDVYDVILAGVTNE